MLHVSQINAFGNTILTTNKTRGKVLKIMRQYRDGEDMMVMCWEEREGNNPPLPTGLQQK
jgi:hypothetical protein